MLDVIAYLGLLFSAFAAATLFPVQSEALLVGMLLSEAYPVWALLVTASIGNVLGACINWLLGRGIERFRDKRWFPLKGATLDKAQRWYGRYGKWSLLLSWAPIIGDPLTVVAGVMRERFTTFLVLVTIAKTGRYAALTAAALYAS